MAPIAGWYDDPRDATALRYWDGSAWTDHVTPKLEPPPETAMPVFPGAVGAQQQSWQYGQPAQQVPVPGAQQVWPPAAPHPPGAAVTPDGVRVTSWGKRFAARLLDGIIVFVGSLPFTGYFLYRYFEVLSDQVNSGTSSTFFPSGDALRWEMAWLGVTVVLELVYETFCLRRWGATPGKRVLDISVRTWDHGGQLSWVTILRRNGFVYGLVAVSLIPVVGVLASVVGLVDYLFPLWDKRRQALHDKAAETVVVEGARAHTP